jgi:hypothetical protein
MLRALCVLVLAMPAVAWADYQEGEVPEGMNAFTLHKRAVHVSLLGTSAIGLTDNTELATYLVADALLFPNLRLEHRFLRGEQIDASLMLGAGAGVYPFAVGAFLPLPGAVVAGGGAGFAWASLQSATVVGSARLTRAVTLSANAGGFALEGGFAMIAGGAVAGGGGGGGGGGTATNSGTRVGLTAGMELAATLGRHDALVVACDVWMTRPTMMDPAQGLLYPRATWTHAWRHFALSGGAYALLDPPSWKSARESKMPVAPYVNVAWNWN